MSKKKLLLSLLFFLAIITLTFYTIFSNTSPSQMISNLKQIKARYEFVCLGLVFMYFLFQGLYTKLIFKSLKTKISLKKGIFYSMIEFFFSGITPSSTGGQPVQLYYMTQDKIPMRKSLIVLILDTIYFKLFLLIASILILIFRSDFVFNNGILFIGLFFLGFIVDLLLTIGCYLLLYHQQIIKNILSFVYKIKDKIKHSDSSHKIDELLDNYKKEVQYIDTHKKEVFLGLIITFVQRMFMFSIAFVIYKAFGFNKFSYIDLLVVQIGVQMAIEGVPLPGGTGASEHLFKILFVGVYGSSLASTAMLLTRLFTFYIPLIIILISIIIVTKKYYMIKFDEK